MKIHFIGIGGIGLSALARFLKHDGHEVSGSDMKSSPLTKTLEEEHGETPREYVRRTLGKYGYSNIKNFDLEWGDLPILVPGQRNNEPLVESSASDNHLDD